MASVREASSPSPPPVDPLSPRAIRPEDEASAEGPTLDEDGLPLNPAQLRSPSGELRVRPRQQRWAGDEKAPSLRCRELRRPLYESLFSCGRGLRLRKAQGHRGTLHNRAYGPGAIVTTTVASFRGFEDAQCGKPAGLEGAHRAG